MTKTSIFICLGISLFGLLWVLGNSYHPFQFNRTRIQNIYDNAENLEAIAAGSSQAGGINFHHLGMRGYGCWRGGSDMFETKYQIESVLSRAPHLNMVFYSVSYTSPFLDNALDFIPDRSKLRIRHYASFGSYRLINGDLKNFILGKCSALIRRDHWKPVIWPGARKKNTATTDQFIFKDEKSLTPGEIEKHALRRTKEALKLVYQSRKLKADLKEGIYRQTGELIRKLKARGVRIIFFTSPYHHRYTENFDRKVVEEMRTFMARISTDFQVPYLDFSEHERFRITEQCFLNSDHLNNHGRRLLAEEIKKRIKL
ncbi:hypothetical protein ACFL5V_01655 [Fibrobacterota bacterium]